MIWNIVADSSIDLFQLEREYENIRFTTVPFIISVGGQDYVDDESMDIPQLMSAMKECKSASSSACPSAGVWLEQFEKEGNVIAITITGNLSGSYASACAARNLLLEEQPDKNIHIIDSLSTGPELILILRQLCRLIEQGLDFDGVVEGITAFTRTSRCTFALLSYDNLVKNGRMSKLKGFVANAFGLCGVGIASEVGTIEIKGIVRGRKKALKLVMEDMEQRSGTVKELVIDHCLNELFAGEVIEAVHARWPEAQTTVFPCRGLCSYYAEMGGLIIAYC